MIRTRDQQIAILFCNLREYLFQRYCKNPNTINFNELLNIIIKAVCSS